MSYQMPTVLPGTPVLYFQDCDVRQPSFAFVLACDTETVNLAVLVRDSWNICPVPHARHITDPLLDKVEVATGGAWDFSEQHKQLAALQANMVRQNATIDLVETNLHTLQETVNKLLTRREGKGVT